MSTKTEKHITTVESEKRRYPGMRTKSVMHKAVCTCGWESPNWRASGEAAQTKDGDVHAPPKPKRVRKPKAKVDA